MQLSPTRLAACWWLLLSSGCTAQYMEATIRTGAAAAGVSDSYQVERAGKFRFVPGTRLYIAIAASPSGANEASGANEPAPESPARIAHIVNAAFSGAFLTTLAVDPTSRETARSAAAAAGSSLLVYPELVGDTGPSDLWHRATLTVRLEIFEVVTGRPVDRVLVHGRAALSNAAVDTTQLQAAMTELAVNLTGGSAPADHRWADLL